MTESNLWALELSVDDAMDEFRSLAKGLDAESLSAALGVPRKIIDNFGLDDLTVYSQIRLLVLMKLSL